MDRPILIIEDDTTMEDLIGHINAIEEYADELERHIAKFVIEGGLLDIEEE